MSQELYKSNGCVKERKEGLQKKVKENRIASLKIRINKSNSDFILY